MIEELDFETYLYISSNEFEILLFNKRDLNNLYKEKIKFSNKSNFIDLNLLNKFLENNIFKIEKLIGNFIKKIYLIIENHEINEITFAVKKKNYEKKISDKFLQSILTDAKDLFRENYQNYYILHMLVIRYLESGNYHWSYNNNFEGDYLCIEFKFVCISNNFISEINNVLGKYQVDVVGCLDSKYIKNYFSDDQIEYSEMIYKIKSGVNENEIKLLPKNNVKTGFFEKFFQLFS